MSAYASVAERARQAFASVARLEAELVRNPTSVALQVRLAARAKLARQAEEQLLELARVSHVEVCKYRLLPEAAEHFSLGAVAKSLLEYQNLFSQIYDALKNGVKERARLGREAAAESALEFGYSFSGSLGVVLLAQNERDFFSGQLDQSIASLYQILNIGSRTDVRQTARTFGNAVVKRLYDWSKANLEGGFAADVIWTRSDGRSFGEVIERRRMEEIVNIIDATSDERVDELEAVGRLVGGDLVSGTFHFVVPNGADYRGRLSAEFPAHTEMTLGKQYRALIRETRTIVYATEKEDLRFELKHLFPPSVAHSGDEGDVQ
jgi:hypothetical protein